MFGKYIRVILLAVAVGFSQPVYAECHKAQICDDFGQNCRAQDICDETTDVPSADIDPPSPMPSADLKPLPSTNLPPPGTTHCEYMQVNGQWQNVCQ